MTDTLTLVSPHPKHDAKFRELVNSGIIVTENGISRAVDTRNKKEWIDKVDLDPRPRLGVFNYDEDNEFYLNGDWDILSGEILSEDWITCVGDVTVTSTPMRGSNNPYCGGVYYNDFRPDADVRLEKSNW